MIQLVLQNGNGGKTELTRENIIIRKALENLESIFLCISGLIFKTNMGRGGENRYS